MGTNQLLFILLGAILIAIAIAVGVQITSASTEQSNRDQIVLDLNNFAIGAQVYYKKTANLGGGRGSYLGWSIPAAQNKNENGSYTTNVKSQRVVITGTGIQLGKNGKTKIKIQATVTPAGITIKTNN